MRQHLNSKPGPFRLAFLLAALLALAIPTMAVGQAPSADDAPGQNKAADGTPGEPPGLVKKDPANPANHNPPVKDRSGLPQNRGNGDNSNGCTGSVKTTVADGSIVNANRYATGDPVYVSGSKFPASAVFNYEVIHVQTKAIVASGSFTGGADGSFLQKVVQDPALTGHEYKVVVYYNTASGHRCHKSDNFFFAGKDVKGAGKTVICVPTESKKLFKELKLPAKALQNRNKKAGDIVLAPSGGCPTLSEVKAVEDVKAPTQVKAGNPFTINVTTVPNAVVTIVGAGVDQTRIAPASGVFSVKVRPLRSGVIVVRGARPGPLDRIGILGASRTSGRSLTG